MLSRRSCFFGNRVEVGGVASVFSVSVILLEIPGFFQIRNRPLDRGAGEAEVSGDGVDSRPTFALGVRAVAEVHIDGEGAVRKLRVRVDGPEKAHVPSPPSML